MLDKAIQYVSPNYALRRMNARANMQARGYDGGSNSRRSMKGWNTTGADADSDILLDLSK